MLHEGEKAAIELALAMGADLLLMDDRAGVPAGQAVGLVVTGTLGVIARGARRGFIDPGSAAVALDRTNFRWTPALRERLLKSSVE